MTTAFNQPLVDPQGEGEFSQSLATDLDFNPFDELETTSTTEAPLTATTPQEAQQQTTQAPQPTADVQNSPAAANSDPLDALLTLPGETANSDVQSAPNANDVVLPPEIAKQYEHFDTYFKAQTGGVDLQTVIQQFNQLQALVARTEATRQEQQLQQQWGEDWSERLTAVRQHFQKLPDTKRQAILAAVNGDEVQAAGVIDSFLRRQNQAATPNVPSIPSGQKVPVASRASAYDFTTSQIERMSPQEYQQNIAAIQKAYATGRVSPT